MLTLKNDIINFISLQKQCSILYIIPWNKTPMLKMGTLLLLREKSEFVYQGFVADSRTTSEISSVCVVGFPLAWLSKQRSIGASFLRQRMIALSGIKSHSIQLNYLWWGSPIIIFGFRLGSQWARKNLKSPGQKNSWNQINQFHEIFTDKIPFYFFATSKMAKNQFLNWEKV